MQWWAGPGLWSTPHVLLESSVRALRTTRRGPLTPNGWFYSNTLTTAAREWPVLRGVVGHLATAVLHRAPRARHLVLGPPVNRVLWSTPHSTQAFRHTVIVCHAFARARWLENGAVERLGRRFGPARRRLHLVGGEALQESGRCPSWKGSGAAEAQPSGVDGEGISAVEAAFDDLAPNRHTQRKRLPAPAVASDSGPLAVAAFATSLRAGLESVACDALVRATHVLL